jgi:hypothetical protein
VAGRWIPRSGTLAMPRVTAPPFRIDKIGIVWVFYERHWVAAHLHAWSTGNAITSQEYAGTNRQLHGRVFLCQSSAHSWAVRLC